MTNTQSSSNVQVWDLGIEWDLGFGHWNFFPVQTIDRMAGMRYHSILQGDFLF